MSFCVQIEDDGGLKTFLRIAEEGITGVLNPDYATVFKSPEHANAAVRNATLLDLGEVENIPLKEAYDHWKAINKQGVTLVEFHDIRDTQFNRAYNPDEDTRWDVLRFYCSSDFIRDEHKRTWPKLYRVFEYLSDARYMDLYKKKIPVISIKRKTADYVEFMREIGGIKKELGYSKNEILTLLVVDRFTYSSDGGNILLHVEGDSWELQSSAGSWTMKPKECFDYLCKHRYIS